jgi:hypothetical protein
MIAQDFVSSQKVLAARSYQMMVIQVLLLMGDAICIAFSLLDWICPVCAHICIDGASPGLGADYKVRLTLP